MIIEVIYMLYMDSMMMLVKRKEREFFYVMARIQCGMEHSIFLDDLNGKMSNLNKRTESCWKKAMKRNRKKNNSTMY